MVIYYYTETIAKRDIFNMGYFKNSGLYIYRWPSISVGVQITCAKNKFRPNLFLAHVICTPTKIDHDRRRSCFYFCPPLHNDGKPLREDIPGLETSTFALYVFLSPIAQ
jgi:hypothetical protein